MQLMKIDSLFTSGIFSNEGIEQLLDQLKATLETTAKTDAPSALSPPSSSTKTDVPDVPDVPVTDMSNKNSDDHVNVTNIKFRFRDSKGNVSEQLKNKNVSKRFSKETCNQFREMLSDLAMSVLDIKATPEVQKKHQNVKCAIVYTVSAKPQPNTILACAKPLSWY